jgi:hypothetical protein
MPEDPVSDRDSPSSRPAGSARRRVAERLDEAEAFDCSAPEESGA